ncbi:MAG: hypothetical protein M0033_11815 [Nitrospiraceae bacterium]|nr:hypothetical protein [Nitrospiraceae bacterium]
MDNNELEKMTVEELRGELERLRDELRDVEDIHSFTFGKTSVHISAEKAQNMQAEFEEERGQFCRRISGIEELLRQRGAL